MLMSLSGIKLIALKDVWWLVTILFWPELRSTLQCDSYQILCNRSCTPGPSSASPPEGDARQWRRALALCDPTCWGGRRACSPADASQALVCADVREKRLCGLEALREACVSLALPLPLLWSRAPWVPGGHAGRAYIQVAQSASAYEARHTGAERREGRCGRRAGCSLTGARYIQEEQACALRLQPRRRPRRAPR